MDGILLINKPIDYTSRDVVNALMKKFQQKKIGHTGTLDPFASGVMVITLGKATKISTFLEATNKKYIAELTLGITTDTLDLTGKVISTKQINMPSREVIEKVFNSFVGDIEQIPPMYSAIKVNGEALYKKARRGESVELKPRKVTIYGLNILSITDNKIIFEVECSKGTYIRSLGKDIADKLGFGGHLSLLTRVSVGHFHIKQCKNINDVCEKDLISILDGMDFFPKIIVDSNLEKKIRNGVRVNLNCFDKQVLVVSMDKQPLAIYEKEQDNTYSCLRGLL